MVRFKNRWILVEFIPCNPPEDATRAPTRRTSEADITTKDIYAALKQSILHNFGDTGWGAVGYSLTVKYFSPMTNVCIIRVGRDQHKIAWAGVTLLSSIEGRKFIPNVICVSGTIKHAQLAAIQHNRVVVARFRALAKTPTGYHDAYDSFLDRSTKEITALQD
ncbi:hypothetical protein GLOTRDRAFT_130347 [Gloeophyllum trabeum ATCC 11539]|uniref:Uncharacterized protein n=1 Tax=Gloeophyllum trabeum (strain ATCC 11539 / FP-39264 / Madison 617) TaxID=670483 RepID=S7Q325_GLOTA|nr:uncharacterized protein GLOTRDRAFT_130347 [Gloeophyllum trabeum ATCC 11539]EPQ53952.1 hypothetical protein GLOTRDRAFT_130347 [Gloeophyllum trabeum ATCC 11539]